MTSLSPTDRAHLVEVVGTQTEAFTVWGRLGTPFYARLSESIAADIADDGPLAALFAPFADRTFTDGYLLRFLGGVHRCVLSGAAPELAAHFPSTGGDGNAEAAFPIVRAMAADPPPDVVQALARTPQTNDVARSAALASGIAVVAQETGLPIRLREIGSSAGLNLRLDAYHYAQDGQAWGDPTSPVRFVDLWEGGVPPFGAAATILDRRGCDVDPIDVTGEEGRLWLLAYIWPEPRERFDRLRAAIELAAADPPTVDAADALEWFEEQVAQRPPGTVLVLQHSVMWHYLADETRTGIEALLRDAGAAATPDAPLARVRLEPNPVSFLPGELTLTLWDGSTPDPPDRLLATTTFHGGPITWLGGVG